VSDKFCTTQEGGTFGPVKVSGKYTFFTYEVHCWFNIVWAYDMVTKKHKSKTKNFLSNKGSLILEPIKSILCFHLFEEQHPYKHQCGGVLSSSLSTQPLKNSHTGTAQHRLHLHDKSKVNWSGPAALFVSRITTGLPWSRILQKQWYVHPLPHSTLSMSLIEFQFISFLSTQWFVQCLLYMFPMVGLHMFYSLLIILMLVHKYQEGIKLI
jgi:hypothetical protein